MGSNGLNSELGSGSQAQARQPNNATSELPTSSMATARKSALSRSSTPERAARRSPSVASEGAVAEEQGSAWHGQPKRSETAEVERYALFGPAEIFSENSAELRRIDPSVVGLSFDEVFSSMDSPWHLDRRDINQSLGLTVVVHSVPFLLSDDQIAVLNS